MPRLFIAIDPPPTQRDRIQTICSNLPGARWIPAAQIHLTLRFIGEVAPDFHARIAAGLAAIRGGPLTLEIAGLGYFPPRGRPRVLWLALQQNERLTELRNMIETTLVGIGLPPEERKFAPHLTIARCKTSSQKNVADFTRENAAFALDPFPVEEFHLYSSRLTSAGASHRREASYRLGTP